MHLDKKALKFKGTVTIHGHQRQSSRSLKLHTKNLNILSATYELSGEQHPLTHHRTGKQDELILTGTEQISGKTILRLEFNGEITEPMVGLYPCTFSQNGREKKLLATQFESHHAREVFPCIDEPAAKATFDLTLNTQSNDVVIANTEPLSQKKLGKRTETRFKTTPKMSTYLLAFVTGDLVATEHTHKSGVTTRVWTTPLHKNHVSFALDVAVRTLDFYNEYFGEDYPLSKCDHVALPDFAAGAMENWGLITYRESLFIVDDENTSLENKQSIALVIAHEIAHQWFGNLVTMEWWTDLWLNEGFASWIEYLAIDSLFPQWRVWDQFVSDEYLSGMALDSLSSSHPIEVQIDDPEEIRSIFDAISYNKGASVIRMLHNFMGAADFQAGLQHYIKQYKYANACTIDLWQSLESVSTKPIRKFMSAWTTQTGYPIVNATVNIKKQLVELRQQRYQLNPSNTDKTIWPVPVDAVGEKNSMLLDKRSATWQLTHPSTFKLNRNQNGWYITHYDEQHLERLVDLIEKKSIGSLDRLGPVHDSFRIAKAGVQSTTEAFRLLEAYRNEDNVVVWDVILSQLGSVKSVFDSESAQKLVQSFSASLLERQYHLLGWQEHPQDNHFQKLLRPLILAQSCASDLPDAINTALKIFDQAKSPQSIHPDIRGLVCATAGKKLGKPAHEKLLLWYKAADSPQIKSQLSAGLCSSRDPALINENLELITSEHVKPQEVTQWVSYLFGNHHAKDAAWDWFRTHWDWLYQQFGTDIMTISYFPLIVGNAFSEKSKTKEYETFFSKIDTTGITQPVAQGKESMQWRSAWKARDEESLLKYLDKTVQDNS